MRIGIIFGPGQHLFTQSAQLLHLGHQVYYTHYQPTFETGEMRLRADGSSHKHPTRTNRLRSYWANRLQGLQLRSPLSRPRAHTYFYRAYSGWAAPQLKHCDLIIAYSMVALPALRYFRRLGIPTVLELPMSHISKVWEVRAQAPPQGGYEKFTSPYLRTMMAKEVEEADYVNTISTFAYQSCVAAGISPDKLLLTPLGIDLARFSPAVPRSQTDRPFRVLFAGRLEFRKGIHQLAEALRDFPADNLELHIAGRPGPGFDGRVLETLPFPVVVRGHLPFPELLNAYAEADVLAFPTLEDGMGLVICEAMAMGLPVITTTHSGGPDIITDGENGLLIPPFDAPALRAALLKLYENPQLRAAMAGRTRARIEADFTLEAYRARLHTMLQKILPQTPKA